MKVLTVCQPYASLIMSGVKRVENRSWKTLYRGGLLIHAGKSREWFGAGELVPDDMVFGALLGRVHVIDCLHIDEIERGDHDKKYPWLKEHAHTEGPWCWVLSHANALQTPIPYKGAQGLRDYRGDQDPWTLPYTRDARGRLFGSRAGAILKADEKTVHLLGYGKYLGELEPPFGPMGQSKEEHDQMVAEMKASGQIQQDYRYTNPCIELDDGRRVWGAQCWWGSEDQVRKMIGDRQVIPATIEME